MWLGCGLMVPTGTKCRLDFRGCLEDESLLGVILFLHLLGSQQEEKWGVSEKSSLSVGLQLL